MNSGFFMELEPYFEVERHRCPFHGFTAILNFMRDSGDNQCALKIGLYDPCQMEMAGDKPCWVGCVFNTEENRKIIEGNLGKIRVFPKEFRPPKTRSWPGISLGDWMIYSQQ